MSTTTPPVPPGQGQRTALEESTPVTPKRSRRVTGRDRLVVVLMVLVPTLFVLVLVWVPAISSVILSFGRWNGIGGLSDIEWIGTENYKNVFTNYPPFWPAIRHNLIWLAFLFLVATPVGMFLAVLLDKEIRGSRFYQTSLYLPVILSLALTGFIWQLMYSRDQGLINEVMGGVADRFNFTYTPIDWYGDPNVNLWAVLVATGWRHVGYVMLLYLAGLKAVDPALREAAKVDGASETKTFFSVVFPVMRPINLIVLVITVVEALRAFDIVWVVNRGRNGLELIATLVTQNIVGEASRIGFGSALATMMLLISSVFVVIYLRTVMKEDR